MEITVYFDSSLENMQKLKPQENPECNPKTIALSIEPNYYGYSIDGGTIIRNPNHVSPRDI
jgi:hypothetical protein